jgi:ribosome-associated heat shock protein Hsp15
MTERVDKWLVAVRVFKSRSQATEACTLGRVTIGGSVAKPSTKVAVGDVVEVRRRDRLVVYEVVEIIDKRVSAARAAECVIDLSPPPPDGGSASAPVAVRDRGAGRPTKRDRRRVDSLRGIDPPGEME